MSTSSPGTGTKYEFSEDENKVIGALGGAIRFVGVVTLILGLLAALGAIKPLLDLQKLSGFEARYGHDPDFLRAKYTLVLAIGLGLIYSSVFIFTGFWLNGAAGSFHQIVATRGSDIAT